MAPAYALWLTVSVVVKGRAPASAGRGVDYVAKRVAVAPKNENRVIRYFKDVHTEIRKVMWPSRRTTINLTAIVFGVTFAMSVALGLIDWIFARMFAFLIHWLA